MPEDSWFQRKAQPAEDMDASYVSYLGHPHNNYDTPTIQGVYGAYSNSTSDPETPFSTEDPESRPWETLSQTSDNSDGGVPLQDADAQNIQDGLTDSSDDEDELCDEEEDDSRQDRPIIPAGHIMILPKPVSATLGNNTVPSVEVFETVVSKQETADTGFYVQDQALENEMRVALGLRQIGMCIQTDAPGAAQSAVRDTQPESNKDKAPVSEMATRTLLATVNIPEKLQYELPYSHGLFPTWRVLNPTKPIKLGEVPWSENKEVTNHDEGINNDKAKLSLAPGSGRPSSRVQRPRVLQEALSESERKERRAKAYAELLEGSWPCHCPKNTMLPHCISSPFPAPKVDGTWPSEQPRSSWATLAEEEPARVPPANSTEGIREDDLNTSPQTHYGSLPVSEEGPSTPPPVSPQLTAPSIPELTFSAGTPSDTSTEASFGSASIQEGENWEILIPHGDELQEAQLEWLIDPDEDMSPSELGHAVGEERERLAMIAGRHDQSSPPHSHVSEVSTPLAAPEQLLPIPRTEVTIYLTNCVECSDFMEFNAVCTDVAATTNTMPTTLDANHIFGLLDYAYRMMQILTPLVPSEENDIWAPCVAMQQAAEANARQMAAEIAQAGGQVAIKFGWQMMNLPEGKLFLSILFWYWSQGCIGGLRFLRGGYWLEYEEPDATNQ